MVTKITNLLFYGGTDREEYNNIKEKILRTNRTTALFFSVFALCLIGFMYFASLNLEEFSDSRPVYIIGVVISFLIFLLSFWGNRINIFINIAVYLAEFFYLSYGLLIGLVTRADQQTTTFMIMIILLPLIFVDRPIITDAIMCIFVIIFCIGAYRLKAEDIKYVDIIDALVFGALSLASGTTIIRIKIKEYCMEHNFKHMSETDILTGLKNRNYYERKLKTYGDEFIDSIACIYFDVNGLHDVNNNEGHEAGDKMLQYIAGKIQEVFGTTNTFRIGGDEYVAIVKDITYLELSNTLNGLVKSIEDHGYNVAWGYDIQSKEHYNIDFLIKSAEANMYTKKREYYKHHNRRRA